MDNIIHGDSSVICGTSHHISTKDAKQFSKQWKSFIKKQYGFDNTDEYMNYLGEYGKVGKQLQKKGIFNLRLVEILAAPKKKLNKNS